jgi:hypothetical protein
MAMFVITMLGLTGVALLHLGSTEMTMSRRALDLKQAFYLAEAGEESARSTLYVADTTQDFSDLLPNYAGVNGVFDLDIDNLRLVYDSAGDVTGVTGVGDDTPVQPVAALGSGFFTAYVTNDPGESVDAFGIGGIATTTDSNDMVMITAIGAGPDRAVEVVQAIVERWQIVPQLPPATITMLGDQPSFEGGTSDPHTYSGDDCPGGIPGLSVPVVGTIGSAAELEAELGIVEPDGPDYDAGPWSQQDTFVDLENPSDPILAANGFTGLDPMWTDCLALHDFVEELRKIADVECVSGGGCAIPPTLVSNVIFVNGDYEINPPGGAGTLVVTGEVEYDGRAAWEGMIYAFGRGSFLHNGSGNGEVSGAIMIANIAGPDGIYGNGDDCTGGDANGFGSADYELKGGGNGDTLYCSTDILTTFPKPPLRIQGFRQR